MLSLQPQRRHLQLSPPQPSTSQPHLSVAVLVDVGHDLSSEFAVDVEGLEQIAHLILVDLATVVDVDLLKCGQQLLPLEEEGEELLLER